MENWLKFLPLFLRNRIEQRQDLQKMLGNTSWLFADKILRMGVGLLVGVWVARYLGPEKFGVMSYAGAFVTLFTVFAGLGLDGIVVRELVRNPADSEEILGTAFLLKLLSGVLTCFVAGSAIVLVRSDEVLTQLIVWVLAVGMVFQSFDVIDYYFQSKVTSKYSVWAKNAAFLLMALVRVSLVLAKAPLIAFALAALGEIIFGAIGLVIVYKAKGKALFDWKPRLAKCRSLLKYSWPLILSGLSIVVYMKIDQVMLGNMVGNKSVGIYSAAIRISEIWYFIPTSICSSVFPSIIEAKNIGEGLYYRRLQRLFNIMTGLSLCLAIPMSFLSTFIVTTLFGKGFAAAGSVLAIHIWTAVFVFLGVAQGAWDLTENLTKLSLLRTSSGAVINILLNLILIPRYSVLGAAMATVISQAFSSVILNSVFPSTRPIFFCQIRSILFWKKV